MTLEVTSLRSTTRFGRILLETRAKECAAFWTICSKRIGGARYSCAVVRSRNLSNCCLVRLRKSRKAEADKAGTTLEASVRWRYIEGFAPTAIPKRRRHSRWRQKRCGWRQADGGFYREGGKGMPRYTHMEGYRWQKVVVPGVSLRRVTEKRGAGGVNRTAGNDCRG